MYGTERVKWTQIVGAKTMRIEVTTELAIGVINLLITIQTFLLEYIFFTKIENYIKHCD